MEIIKSRENAKVKYIKSLGQKKFRNLYNEFVVEGAASVEEAVIKGAGIKFFALSAGQTEKFTKYTAIAQTYVFEENVFNILTDTKNSQGIIAVCAKNILPFDKIKVSDSDYYIFCEDIKDPGNLGTIVRSAAAFGAAGVILSGECVDVYNEKVIRATMGNIFSVPIYECIDKKSAISHLKKQNVKILAASPESDNTLSKIQLPTPLCIVLGSESCGISSFIKNECDIQVKIEMSENVESLNVAVAGSVIMYHVYKNNRFGE